MYATRSMKPVSTKALICPRVADAERMPPPDSKRQRLTAAEIETLRAKKEKAIKEQDFEGAAAMRDREKQAKEKLESVLDAGADVESPNGDGQTALMLAASIGALDIAGQIAVGLQAFGRSEEFADVLRAGEVPHPFDSHPPLSERMRKVGHVVAEADFAQIVSRRPEATWADAVNDAATIEERLWRAYENDFSQMHEESLAYRYLPATEEETALVLRHFPPVRFALKHGREIEVNHEGIVHPHSGALIPWDSVAGLQFDEPAFRANRLVVKHPEKGMLGAKSTRISIAIARAERD
ncbi:MAG: hypothetical protein HC794_06170, partial [Nitrospiraceae bacterium]|nr:hypothetical protein [Nitrospiraceae bacterium]